MLAVLDARAMAQTAGALALGLRDYPVQLAGVLANRVAGDTHAAMVADRCAILAIGPFAAPGLVAAQSAIWAWACPTDWPTLTPGWTRWPTAWCWTTPPGGRFARLTLPPGRPGAFTTAATGTAAGALARDAAFAFVYPANLACLRPALGAELVEFATAGQPLPAGVDALYLPGGYPGRCTLKRNARTWQSQRARRPRRRRLGRVRRRR